MVWFIVLLSNFNETKSLCYLPPSLGFRGPGTSFPVGCVVWIIGYLCELTGTV